MTENQTRPLFFPDELDASIRVPLSDLASQGPDESRLQASLEHIRRRSPANDTGEIRRSALRGYRLMASAVCLLTLLWFGAQTKAWGQVAQDLQRTPVAAPSADQSPINSPKEVGPVMRFVLIVHVFSHLGGMFGLTIIWILSLWRWLLAMWQPAKVPRRTRGIHIVALSLYGLAIVLGSCWSQVTFGKFWRWDPREAFALLTLCVGIVWYLSVNEDQGNAILQIIHRTVIASMSFGLIMLMQGLAIPYSRQNQSYGFPSIILILLAANLAAVLASRWWFARMQDAFPT